MRLAGEKHFNSFVRRFDFFIGLCPHAQAVGNMLRAEALPEKLMAPCLDVLRTLSPSERDLIRLVVETVQELRDDAYGEDEDEAPPVCIPFLFVI